LNGTIDTDILVVGGGGAGVRAAIEAAEGGFNVVCLSKGPVSRSGITPVAGEGIEAAIGEGDTPHNHFADTIKAGRGLACEDLVRVLVEGAVEAILELESYGARFKKSGDGTFIQTPRPGQSHSRNLYLKGGGWGIMRALLRKAGTLGHLKFWEDTVAVKLLQDEGRVCGALVLDVSTGLLHVVRAKAVILATGGYEELWPVTDTPPESTGEGAVLAFSVGATLIDMEMVLYYPTVFIFPAAAKGWLLEYEYIMNPDILDGRLLNGNMEEFIEGFPLRDEIIKAVFREIKEGRATPHGGFYLDFSKSRYGKEELTKRLKRWVPVMYNNLKSVGIDIVNELTEMMPAAHYSLGGIRINASGETGVAGLFAAGEAAGNVHGANRLSGNALAEILVFGKVAARKAMDYVQNVKLVARSFADEQKREVQRIESWIENRGGIRPRKLKRKLKQVMGGYVGWEREASGLKKGLALLEELRSRYLTKLNVQGISRYCYEIREAYEVCFMFQLAELVILSSLEREESRGHHLRLDFPGLHPTPYHTLVSGEEGAVRVCREPVEKKGWICDGS